LQHVGFVSAARGYEQASARELYPQEAPAGALDLLIVPESEEWLLPIAAPLASKLGDGDEVPVLLVISAHPSKETIEAAKRLSPRGSLVLSSDPRAALAQHLEGLNPCMFSTSHNPVQAGVRVAQAFWCSSSEVVLARMNDPQAVILGSLLAANLEIPFIPVGDFQHGKVLSRCLAGLGVQRVLVAAADTTDEPSWADTVEARVEILDAPAIYRILLGRVGAKNVRNILLTRAPRGPPDSSITSWLAPDLGLLRSAPVVVCDSADAEEAEQKVLDLVHEYGLSPRTVTILADYGSIGVIELRDQAALGEYELSVEPCSGPGKGGAAAFGVGRIPCYSLEEASVLIACGIARDRLLGASPARVLLVANPGADYGPLPLCETISRATAEEFKNFGLEIDEFYGKPSGDPEVSDAAGNADLIIYEGHITDQQLFEDPLFLPDPGNTDLGDLGRRCPADAAYHLSDIYLTIYSGASRPSNEEIWMIDTGAPEPCQSISDPSVPSVEELVPDEPPDIPPLVKDTCLNRMPLVVFQSCHSLEEPLARRVFQSGGVAVMGSTTNVHSASGSAFVKAFCDGLLYRGDTVGEALRDARNYFLCLAALKAKRGHKEQAKVVRAALSFRLWGDPEVRILPYSLRGPSKSPVSARFGDGNDILIRTPARRLAECETEKYLVRMFPGCQLAGIVKRLKEKPVRRIMPMYFFRLPMPEGLATHERMDIHREGDTSPRATFLVDPLKRFVYVLYFPEKVKRRQGLVLQFKEIVEEPCNMLNWEGIKGGEVANAGIMDNNCPCLAGCDMRCHASEGQAGLPLGTW